jgi:subtilisin family serine protease
MRKYSIPFLLVIAILSSCKKDITEQNDSSISSSNQGNQIGSGNYVSNELLIKFKSGLSENEKLKALSVINGHVSEKIFTKAMQHSGEKEGVYLIRTPLAALDAIGRMKMQNLIEFAEPNFTYQHDVTSNDPYYSNGSLWGMYGNASTPANKFGTQAAEAWAVGHTGSSSIFVGVIDEGAMYSHEDLSANFWTNPYDPVDGLDNDGNGYTDDIHGWDFVGNDNSTFDGISDDHGTHVSGTIGARGGNGKGVAGVNWKVTIISAKFLGKNGGTTANAIKAIDYITDLKLIHGLNLPVTNNSWSGGGFSQALKSAIARANNANILFVAAAGNSGNNIDATPTYPASYSNANIIAVAAIDSKGNLASWSNYGSTSVDLGAPGVGVNSTLPARSGGSIISSYGSYSGTSMATPHVTGAAALYAATHFGATAAQIKNAILSATVPTASLAGKTVAGGRLNVSGF